MEAVKASHTLLWDASSSASWSFYIACLLMQVSLLLLVLIFLPAMKLLACFGTAKSLLLSICSDFQRDQKLSMCTSSV
jgi:uncharacterized membrane protein